MGAGRDAVNITALGYGSLLLRHGRFSFDVTFDPYLPVFAEYPQTGHTFRITNLNGGLIAKPPSS
jgi:hypothetical protein